jgi:hypothetical protein
LSTDQPSDHVYTQDDQQQAEIDQYWTEERMQEAVPVPMPSLTDDEFEALVLGQAVPTLPMIVPSGESATAAGAAYPVNVDQRPYWNAGKWFFTNDSGQDMVGSAAFVGTNRVVMTAGHCVRNGNNGQWYRNFLFIRAGIGHWYGWTGQRVGISRVGCYYMWAQGPNYKYDYAFGAATSDSGAGWLGLTTGIPYSAFTSLGYPSNYDNANSMYAADGNKASVSGGIVRMSGNPMGPGCSGGPWVGNLSHEYKPDANIACGLNSFRYASEPDSMYGPYFDAETWHLYTCIQTGGSC